MKNEKMGGTMSLGFTPTNHDPTRIPPLSPLSISHDLTQNGASRGRLGWSVGELVG